MPDQNETRMTDTEPSKAAELESAIIHVDVRSEDCGVDAITVVLAAARRELARLREPKPAPPLEAIETLMAGLNGLEGVEIPFHLHSTIRYLLSELEAFVKAGRL
jgi:hypothetical protein